MDYANIIFTVEDGIATIKLNRPKALNALNSEINDFEAWAHHDDSTSLTTNWRSLPAIVQFNNAFFQDLAAKLDQMIGSERIRSWNRRTKTAFPSNRRASKTSSPRRHANCL